MSNHTPSLTKTVLASKQTYTIISQNTLITNKYKWKTGQNKQNKCLYMPRLTYTHSVTLLQIDLPFQLSSPSYYSAVDWLKKLASNLRSKNQRRCWCLIILCNPSPPLSPSLTPRPLLPLQPKLLIFEFHCLSLFCLRSPLSLCQ